jgi:hypothetical protein
MWKRTGGWSFGAGKKGVRVGCTRDFQVDCEAELHGRHGQGAENEGYILKLMFSPDAD